MTTIQESFEARAPLAPIVGKPKKVANNTFRYMTEDGREVVRLHRTDIIVKRPDGKVVLDTGGWKTPTTKGRFNDFTPFRVSSGRGKWMVSNGSVSAPYFDGMVLPDDLAATSAKVQEEEAWKKAIKKFVLKTLATGCEIPKPGNGDCWYCLMFDAEPKVEDHGINGYTSVHQVRREGRDNGHLLEHIREGYMHGSLIVNAYRSQGYKDEAISYYAFGQHPNYAHVRRMVTKYLCKRLGLVC